MADGSVKIDVQLLLHDSDAQAKALKGDLQDVDIKTSAADHAKQLAEAIKQASNAAKQGKSAQDGLRVSLASQAKYWDQLANAQEKVGLKTSASVSKLSSLKAQLAQVGVETQQATAKLKQAVIAEGSNSDAAKDAASALAELKGKQAALGLETAQLEKKFGGLTPAMADAADKANAVGDKFQSAGEKISSIGNKMTVGLTAPIAAGFALAGKAAITFDSQIQSMGSLLDDGTISASTLKSELKGLGDASKSWSTQYGVSTSSINDGMSELIKKGYTYNQVLGAMPSILDAARASGDDFNSVMSVSTSVLEQFGLKSNNTATMLKNTQRVTDSLSYVANKTSAGFSDMGEAMEYVGPVANGLHMSLEQTASAIGLMSNQGIEGEKAGTALRGALSQLMNPSKQNEIGFKRLGVSVSAFKKGTIGLPEIIDSIRASSKGMTAQQLQSNLALAFGTEAVSGMNILVNEGGDALRNMTKETQSATGYTKKLAETMNNTAQANVDKFKSSLNVLAITAGQELLPQITKLVETGTDLVKWFNDLDKSTQQTIIKTLALTAAVGPLLSGIGKVSSGVGALVHGGTSAVTFLSRFASGAGKAKTESELLGEILEQLTGKTGTTAAALTAATGAAEKTGVGLAAAGTSSTGLLASLAPLAPALIGVGVAAAAGIAWWEVYGKKAQESGERASRWGTDIGAAADKSAGKMATASGKISGAFTDTNRTVQDNAKTIVAGFDSMTSAAKKAASQSDAAAKSLAKSLGGSAGAALLAAAEKEKSANATRIKQMQANAKQAEQITNDAAKKNEALTADQLQVLENLRQSSAAQAVKTMQLSGKEQGNVLKAILGERVTMSKQAADKQFESMQNALQDEYKADTAAQQKIKNSEVLTATEKHAALEGLEKDHQTKLSAIYQGAIQAMKNQGLTNAEIQEQLQSAFDLTATKAQEAMGTYTDAMSKGTKSSKQFAASVTDDMSKATRKAGNDWNSLVLDPKTGKVKTNLAEVLKDTASTKDGWEQLVFDLKHAKISSNAKQTIVDALAASDQWKSLPSWEKNAIITTQGRPELADLMGKFIDWNAFTLTQQQAIVKGDYAPLIDGLIRSEQWNDLTLKDKAALVHDKATTTLLDALIQSGQWNKLPLAEKQAIIQAKGAPDVAALYLQYGQFEALPDATKKAALDNAGFRDKLEATIASYAQFKALPDATKKALMEDGDFRLKLAGTITTFDAFKALPDATKKALMDDSDARQKLIDMGVIIDDYNLNHNPTKKTATADTANAQNNFGLGTASVDKYKNTSPGATKVGKGDTKSTQSSMKTGTDWINKYKGTDPGKTKVGKGDTKNTVAQMVAGANATTKYKGTSPGGTKVGMGDTRSTLSQMRAGVTAVDQYRNRSTGATKVARGSDQASKPLSTALRSWKAVGGNETVNKVVNVVAHGASKVLSLLGLAHGDTYFGGGLATVNDAYGAVYREAIRLPTGETFSFADRNVTAYFPRGTEVVPATKSLQSGLVPRYASGTGGPLTDAIDRASASPIWTMTAESASSFVPQTISLSMDSKSAAAFGAITDALGKVQEAMLAMVKQPATEVIRIENVTELDKKVLSRQIAPDIRVNLNRIDRTNSRRKGTTR